MEILNTITAYLILALIYAGGRGADIWSSRNYLAYGLSEANKWFQKADGSFDTQKNVIASGVWLAVTFAVGLVYAWGAGSVLLLYGFYSYAQAYLNFKAKKEMRAVQTAALTDLRNGLQVNLGWLITRKPTGRKYFAYFPWVYSANPDDAQATAEILERLRLLAMGDPGLWFVG